MPQNEMIFPRVRTFIGLARDMTWLALLFAPIFGLMLFGLFAWNREAIRDAVRDEFGIVELASAESVQEVSEAVAVLSERVRRATGEDRVIRQLPGLSYVSEPVRVGEPVILNLAVERTQFGASCTLRRGQSLFTDTTGVTIAGSEMQVNRQIGRTQTRVRTAFDAPDDLIPGRIELYLALEYECGNQTVFDRTDTVSFKLLEP